MSIDLKKYPPFSRPLVGQNLSQLRSLHPISTELISPPPSDDEEETSAEEEEENNAKRRLRRSEVKSIEVSSSVKEIKKRERKELDAVHAAELARKKALKGDHDAFSVAVPGGFGAVDGEDGADANIRDITIKEFSVSAPGKQLLKDASVKISHGKRYGLVGPNGTGKITLLKLLAWRKIPVPKNG